MKFTREEAIERCSRKIKPNKYKIVDVCYYDDFRHCELTGELCEKRCIHYLNDISYTNRVHEEILHNPEWVKNHWHKLSQVDKELYIAIYGGA